MLKKLLITFALLVPLTVSAQVFNQGQLANPPYVNGGVPYSTSSATSSRFSMVSTSTLSSLLNLVGQARAAISSTVTGLTYTPGTGVLSQTAGYVIPLVASTTEWATAYASSTAASIRAQFSNTVTGLTYNSSTGVTSQTAGYNIPLTASTTNWNDFWNTPSTRITAGANCSWTVNTFNCTGGAGGSFSTTSINGLATTTFTFATTSTGGDISFSTSSVGVFLNVPTASASNRGALSSADWSTFNNKAPTASPAFTGNMIFVNASGTGLTLTSTLNVTGKTTLGNASTSILTATGLFSSGNLAVASNATIGGTLDVTGKTTMNTASSTIFTSTGLFSSGNLSVAGNTTVTGTTGLTGKLTMTTGSSTIFTSTGLFSSGNLAVASNGTFGGTLDITGKTTMTTASSTIFTSTGLFSSGNLTVDGQTTTLGATTTNFRLVGPFYDQGNTTGTLGNVLISTGTSTRWLATSSLGITASLSGGVIDRAARWLTTTTLGTGLLIDTGTVAGVNGTSSTALFNIQGVPGSTANPFQVSTTTATTTFAVTAAGRIGIGTSTPLGNIQIYSNSQSGCNPSFIFGGNAGGDTDFTLCRWNDNDSADDDNLTIHKGVDPSTFSAATALFTLSQAGNLGIGSSTPVSKFIVQGTSGSTQNVFTVASSTNTSLFAVGPQAALSVNNSFGTLGNVLLSNGSAAAAAWTSTSSLGLVGLNSTDTLTNKRITVRVQATTTAATTTPSWDNDDMVTVTAQATTLGIATSTGTCTQGQKMVIRIKDNGSARTINYGSIYRAVGVTLPTTTVINKTLYLGMFCNTTDTKIDVVAVAQES